MGECHKTALNEAKDHPYGKHGKILALASDVPRCSTTGDDVATMDCLVDYSELEPERPKVEPGDPVCMDEDAPIHVPPF